MRNRTYLFGNFLAARYPPPETVGDTGTDDHSTTTTPSSSRPTKPEPSRKTTQTSDEPRRCKDSDKMGDSTEVDRLVKRNLELLESGNFSDAEIICNGKVWKVHKVILRSGCVWFDKAFANNWQEAQTGRIDLKEQQPERINDLLKFIYSGRFTPISTFDAQVMSAPALEVNASLWLTADYFLLPGLKNEIYDYLIDRVAATLCFLHTFDLQRCLQTKLRYAGANELNTFNTFFADLAKAVGTAYRFHAAREIHKLLAVFVCGLREHMRGPLLRDLTKNSGFQKDVFTALIALNFKQATVGNIAQGLTVSCHSATHTLQCAACRKVHVGVATRLPDMTFDPFSMGAQRWCDQCAFSSMKALLKTIISAWPADLG